MKMQAISSIKKVIFILIFLCFSQLVYAVAVPPVQRVVDLTHTLTAQQITQLSGVLQQFEAQKGAQIAVLIVNTTEPETIEQYGLRAAQTWKLGRKKIDDGALLVVAMKDRTMRIEVGYGLEGALNDAICKRIISEVITPYFKKGQFYEGIEKGVNQMKKIIQGESLPATNSGSFPVSSQSNFDYSTLLMVIFGSLFFSELLRSLLGNSTQKRMTAATFIGIIAAIIVWFVTISLLTSILSGGLAFIFALIGFSSKGGSGGGGRKSGGGFSGGGGSFGGGGSSGRW